MIARWLLVASVGLCLIAGTGGCRPKNKPVGSTTQTAAKPKRTWFGLGPPKKEPAYSATAAQPAKPKRTWFGLGAPKKEPATKPVVAQEPKPKRTWFGLGPPKKAPTTAQVAVKNNDGSRFKSQAQTPRQPVVRSDPPPPAKTAPTRTQVAAAEPKPAKRGWFGFGSDKDRGPAYVAQGERVETDMAEPVEIDVLANEGASRKDLDLDKITRGPQNGSARIREAKDSRGQTMQMIVYTPNRKFSGDDEIRYLVERGSEKSEATATIHVRQRGTLRFSAVIDHKEVVMIRGNELWFRHKYGSVPTDMKINGHAADPGYAVEEVLASGDSWKMNFAPGMPTDKPFKVSASGGPTSEAEMLIVEEPKAENNYTTTLMLSDPREGTRRWDVEVRFEAE